MCVCVCDLLNYFKYYLYVYDFRADHLVLDKHFSCSLQSWLPAVFCIQMGTYQIPLFHVSMPIGVSFSPVIFRQLHWWGRHHGCSFPAISRRRNLIADYLVLWWLQSFWSFICCVSWDLGAVVVLQMEQLDLGTHDLLFSAFWPDMVLCNAFCLLQREVSFMRG